MKRIVQLVASALMLTISAAPASSLNMTASLSLALTDAVEAARALANPAPLLRGADFAISTFDAGVVKSFAKAWGRSGNGTSQVEGVVLILRMAGGGYSGRDMGSTNEHKQFTFRWHPATIAIVHTHPNSSDPRPCDDDLIVAEKYHVPIFTITSRGMFVYDPLTRKVSEVLRNLDWLDASKFSKAVLAKK
ncbi:MAG: hypothetical protein WAV20_20975 [Blastocatellia bacterium]